MSTFARPIQNLIEKFEKLPGIGPKSAARMVYHFLKAPAKEAKELSEALVDLKDKTVECRLCFNVAERSPCNICDSPQRGKNQICVVEEPLDVLAFERAGGYEGLYFVLGGVISPVDGIGPEELRIGKLLKRVKSELEGFGEGGERKLELILATNPNLEGEATATYISQQIGEQIATELRENLEISRLARGLPTGADLEYADRLTLVRALEGRTRV